MRLGVYPIIYKGFIHLRWFSRRISEPSTVAFVWLNFTANPRLWKRRPSRYNKASWEELGNDVSKPTWKLERQVFFFSWLVDEASNFLNNDLESSNWSSHCQGGSLGSEVENTDKWWRGNRFEHDDLISWKHFPWSLDFVSFGIKVWAIEQWP